MWNGGYKVEKKNAFMLLQTYWDLLTIYFNIHIWLTSLLEKQVSWYIWKLV